MWRQLTFIHEDIIPIYMMLVGVTYKASEATKTPSKILWLTTAELGRDKRLMNLRRAEIFFSVLQYKFVLKP